jgi:Flp pilus assembly protein TadB
MIKQLMNFVFKLIKEQTPTKEEFKTQTGKTIFKVLLLILGVLLCLILIGIVLGFYLLSCFLKVLGYIFLFGAAADFAHNRRQDKHYEENGRYF